MKNQTSGIKLSDGPDVIDLTRRLLAVDTQNPPGNEETAARLTADILSSFGFDIRFIPLEDKRLNLIALIRGKDKPLCFTGHFDTVPTGNKEWSKDPFKGDIIDGKLFGRGASDMKSGLAAMVTAAARLSKAFSEQDEKGLMLVLTAGEERGCAGAEKMAAEKSIGIDAGALVVGEPTANYPMIGHKGALWLKASAKGVSAHGSMPEMGDNAIYKIANLAVKLSDFDFKVPPHPVLGLPTLNVGLIRGGDHFNLVPDYAEMGIDVRTIPGLSHDAVMDLIRKTGGDGIAVTPEINTDGVYTDSADEWIQRIFRIIESFSGTPPEPRGVMYFTDASPLKKALGSPPVVILGPGEPSTAHKVDEYVYVDRVKEAVDIYTRIGMDWLDPKPAAAF